VVSPKLLRQESVDPPAGQFDSAGDAAEREALAAFEKETFGEVPYRKRSMKLKTKLLSLVVALSYAPLLVAGDEVAYPKEKVAAFVVEKLDLTSLPSAFRPKKEKGKKTFTDYGFTAQTVNENEALIEAASGVRRLAIKVLEQKPSGIYVCVVEPGENGSQAKTQSVILLKRKDSNALLKGRESFREFAACPVIGGSDSSSNSY